MYSTPCPNEKLHRLADATPSMLAHWDSDLRCRFANRAYRHWFGADPQQMLGTSIHQLLGPALFAQNEPFIRGALAGNDQVFERTIRTPGGVVRHSLARYTPDIVDGTPSGFFVEVTDVTHIKSIESALQQELVALQMKRDQPRRRQHHPSDHRRIEVIEEFQRAVEAELEEEKRRRSISLAQLAHELRSSMAPRDGHELQPTIGPVKQTAQSNRLLRLIDDLSDLTRINAGF